MSATLIKDAVVLTMRGARRTSSGATSSYAIRSSKPSAVLCPPRTARRLWTVAVHRRTGPHHRRFAQLWHQGDVHAAHASWAQTWRAAYWETPHPREEIVRLRAALAPDADMISLRLTILGPHYAALDVTLRDFRPRRGVRPHRLDAPRPQPAPGPRWPTASGGRRAAQPVREYCARQRPQRRAIGRFRRPRRSLRPYAGIRANFRT